MAVGLLLQALLWGGLVLTDRQYFFQQDLTLLCVSLVCTMAVALPCLKLYPLAMALACCLPVIVYQVSPHPSPPPTVGLHVFARGNTEAPATAIVRGPTASHGWSHSTAPGMDTEEMEDEAVLPGVQQGAKAVVGWAAGSKGGTGGVG